jgi:hypothetical protein
MIRTLGTIIFTIATLSAQEKVQVSKTENVEFGGTLTLKNSIGDVSIQGWDQPGLQITIVKSTKHYFDQAKRDEGLHQLDAVHTSISRNGDETVLWTEYQRRAGTLTPPLPGAIDFDLTYQIRVPRGAKVNIQHHSGEIHLENLTGDIHATDGKGEIMVYLPDDASYSIDARARFGGVTSNVPGQARRRHLIGQSFVGKGEHQLYLRIGNGDIMILKTLPPQAATK